MGGVTVIILVTNPKATLFMWKLKFLHNLTQHSFDSLKKTLSVFEIHPTMFERNYCLSAE